MPPPRTTAQKPRVGVPFGASAACAAAVSAATAAGACSRGAPRTHSARKAAAPAPAAPGRAAAASASRSAPSSASAHPGRVSLAPPCLARAGRCCTGELDADQGECCADEREAVATQQKIQMKMQGPDWGQTTCLMQTRPASAWPRRRGSARAPTPGPPSHAA